MRFSLKTLLIATFFVACFLGVWVWRDYIPGTFYRDDQGFPHGTGTDRSYYLSGALRADSWHVAGVLRRMTWYRPDGSVVATSRFSTETGGVGYYLREDGSIRVRVRYAYHPGDRLFIAEGPATYYDEKGAVEEVVEYHEGSLLERDSAD